MVIIMPAITKKGAKVFRKERQLKEGNKTELVNGVFMALFFLKV